MGSQISYIKMIRRDIRTRGWVPLLIAVLLIIVMPVAVLLQTENKLQWAAEAGIEFSKADMAVWFQELIGAGNGRIQIITIFCAMVIAVTGFSYLHSVEKTDFYYALPVKRSQFMAGRYFGGALMFAVPYVINYLLVIIIGGRYGIEMKNAGFWYVRTVSVTMLYFFLFYTLSALAMFLTGKLLAGILLTAGFFSYGMLLSFVFRQLCIKYFDTFLDLEGQGQVFSPLGAYNREGRMVDQGNAEMLVWYLTILAVVVGLYILLIICAKFRPTEAAEHAIAFRQMEGIIKIAITVPGALACGLLVFMDGAENQHWFVLSCLGAAVILSFAVSFSYHMDPTEFLKIRMTTIASVLLVGGVIAAFYYDLAGYDSYLPKESQLSGMAVKFDGLLKYYGGMTQNYDNAEQMQLEKMEVDVTPEMYEEICKLAAQQDSRKKSEEYDPDTFRVSIMYHLENGQKAYRAYYGKEDKLRTFAKKMLDREDYVQKLCNMEAFLACTLQDGSIQDLRTKEIPLQFDDAKLHELFALYAKELQKANVSQLTQEHIVGELSASYSIDANKDAYTTEYFSIYDSFESVIAYLEDAGFQLNQAYVPEDILSISVEDYRDDKGDVRQINMTDQEQIRAIFPYLSKYAMGAIWYEPDCRVENIMLSVVWKDGNTGNYELRAGGEDLL